MEEDGLIPDYGDELEDHEKTGGDYCYEMEGDAD